MGPELIVINGVISGNPIFYKAIYKGYDYHHPYKWPYKKIGFPSGISPLYYKWSYFFDPTPWKNNMTLENPRFQ